MLQQLHNQLTSNDLIVSGIVWFLGKQECTMEVDSDIDTQLLQQFSSMGTNDKEVLIAEFQRLLGDQLNADGCSFYLDMNNWNLQAAICSYYDLEQPIVKLPSMALVRDITIGEGESIQPNTHFMKTWRIQNSGDEPWPPGCCLRYVSGEQFGHRDRVMVDVLQPGALADVSIEMVSPSENGIHQGRWRMTTATGSFFGEFIWVILQVDDTGLMGVTQQMSSFGSELIQHSPQRPGDNPFASPVKDSLSPNHVNHFSPSVTNPPSQTNYNEQNHILQSSPMGSDIAQHGSFPNSPCVPVGMQGSGNLELSHGQTVESIRAALFQGPDTMSYTADVPPDISQGSLLPVSTLTSSTDNQLTDSIEMS